jgi:hypothetical protein
MSWLFSNPRRLAAVSCVEGTPLAPGGGFLWRRQDRQDHASVARAQRLAV